MVSNCYSPEGYINPDSIENFFCTIQQQGGNGKHPHHLSLLGHVENFSIVLSSPPPLAIVKQIWIPCFPSFLQRLKLLHWCIHYPLRKHYPLVRQIIESRVLVPALSKKMLSHVLLGIFSRSISTNMIVQRVKKL